MKSFKVLLHLLAVFSPVLVLSQKVDPLASSSVVRTTRTEADDVSSAQLTDHTTTTPLEESIAVFSPVLVLSQKVDPLASSSVVRTTRTEADDVSPTAHLTDHTTTTPLEESIVDKRGLNGVTTAPTTAPLCKKFTDYVAVDDGVTTLRDWCDSLGDKKCCSGGYGDECSDWSDTPDTTYEVCENSCVGQNSCYGVASNAPDGSSIRFEEGSCTSYQSCKNMAQFTTKKVNIRVGENSCTDAGSCDSMAAEATNLEELIIQENSCAASGSCSYAAYSATWLKHLFINNSCTDEYSCLDCGSFSIFDEILQLTKDCCAQSGNSGTNCQYSEPSASPSISSIPSIQPSSIPSDIPSDVPSDQPTSVPSDVPSDIPSDVPSDQPTSVPSDVPSDIPSDVPSDQPTSVPSDVPSDIPSDIPSDQPTSVPSDVPSNQPSNLPSSEPSWLDDEQCKKKDPENDICAELDGRCKIDCEDDEDFLCVPCLCSYDKKWDKPTKSPKMRQLMNGDVEMVDMEITATGNAERKLKSKATKAAKSSCACRVPKRRGYN